MRRDLVEMELKRLASELRSREHRSQASFPQQYELDAVAAKYEADRLAAAVIDEYAIKMKLV